jgi:hypothetical protein
MSLEWFSFYIHFSRPTLESQPRRAPRERRYSTQRVTDGPLAGGGAVIPWLIFSDMTQQQMFRNNFFAPIFRKTQWSVWRWRQHVPGSYTYTSPHDVTFQNTGIFITTAVTTSDVTPETHASRFCCRFAKTDIRGVKITHVTSRTLLL